MFNVLVFVLIQCVQVLISENDEIGTNLLSIRLFFHEIRMGESMLDGMFGAYM